MLTLKEARKIGLKKCREIIGEEYIEKYKDFICSGYSAENKPIISVFLGVNKNENEKLKLLAGESHFNKEAYVYVDRRTGKIKIDNE